MTTPHNASHAPGTSADLSRPDVNERMVLTVVPLIPGRPEPLPGGGEGTYSVRLVFGVPGRQVFQDKLNFEEISQSGDSLLKLPPNAALMRMDLDGDGRRAQIDMHPNTHGRLAYALMRVTAPNFGMAESFAFDLVSPMLSRLSFEHDVALDVVAHAVTEEATQSVRLNVGVIGRTKIMTTSSGTKSNPEIRMLMSPYRDGLGSTNVFFQVLSFYKVIEGIFLVRTERQSAARATGHPSVRHEHEHFPNTADAFPEFRRVAFSKFLGKRFTTVRDDLRPLYRNAIAHLDPSQPVLVADRYADTASCLKSVPVLRYMARIMLTTEVQRAANASAMSD